MKNNLYKYENELKFRNEILTKIHNREKISSEERQWLMTHKLYNRFYGYPYLNIDIIQLEKNTIYSINVKIKSKKYADNIIPFFTAAAGKGEIANNGIVFDNNGKSYSNKKVKMLGCLLDSVNDESFFHYKSQLGLLAVSYQCQYYDELQNSIIRKNSNTGDPNLAMRKEQITPEEIIYYCKAPINEDFHSLVFSVKFKKLN